MCVLIWNLKKVCVPITLYACEDYVVVVSSYLTRMCVKVLHNRLNAKDILHNKYQHDQFIDNHFDFIGWNISSSHLLV